MKDFSKLSDIRLKKYRKSLLDQHHQLKSWVPDSGSVDFKKLVGITNELNDVLKEIDKRK